MPRQMNAYAAATARCLQKVTAGVTFTSGVVQQIG